MRLATCRLAAIAGCAFTAAALAAPQSGLRAPQGGGSLDPAKIIGSSCGVHRSADGWLGAGPGYRVRFGPDAVTFESVAFEAVARRDGVSVLRLCLESVTRNGGERPALGPPTRSQDGRVVRYARSAVVETYEVRRDGLEQSFVFAERPSGTGDLVVRCRAETGLPLTHAAPDELRFGGPGDGVRIGAVIGIDANKETVPGALTWRDGVVEMSLPAAFVDRAALPLVLDPLISTEASTGQAPFFYADGQVDVAYNPASDLYLVAWDAFCNGCAGSEVHGQLVRGDGTLQGPTLFLVGAGSGFWAHQVRVASVLSTRGFVYGCIGGRSNSHALWGSVTDSGQVRFETYVGGGPLDFARHIDLGGEATSADDDVLVVFENPARGVIRLAEVEPGTGATLGIDDLAPGSEPAISATGGPRGRHLVTWSQAGDIFGAVVDRDRTVLAGPFAIADTPQFEVDADVDGDGTHWVVAFERGATPAAPDRDIHCRGVTYDERTGTAYLTPAAVPVASGARAETDPAVAWVGDSYLVGYVRHFGFGDYDVWVRSLESFGCRDCEGTIAVARTQDIEREVRIVGLRGGDEALITWRSTRQIEGRPQEQTGRAMFRRFRADDGWITDLGGGCGQGGTGEATCAARGVPAMGVRLQHAAPLVPAALVVGVTSAAFVCGPCTLQTLPVATVAGVTDARGNIGFTSRVANDPGLVGTRFLAQWAVLAGSGPCGAGLDLSNALSLRIQ